MWNAQYCVGEADRGGPWGGSNICYHLGVGQRGRGRCALIFCSPLLLTKMRFFASTTPVWLSLYKTLFLHFSALKSWYKFYLACFDLQKISVGFQSVSQKWKLMDFSRSKYRSHKLQAVLCRIVCLIPVEIKILISFNIYY